MKYFIKMMFGASLLFSISSIKPTTSTRPTSAYCTAQYTGFAVDPNSVVLEVGGYSYHLSTSASPLGSSTSTTTPCPQSQSTGTLSFSVNGIEQTATVTVIGGSNITGANTYTISGSLTAGFTVNNKAALPYYPQQACTAAGNSWSNSQCTISPQNLCLQASKVWYGMVANVTRPLKEIALYKIMCGLVMGW